MQQYLDLLRDVLTNGVCKPTRAVLRSTGKPVEALSVFGRMMQVDLADGFPLLTTRRISFNVACHELVWFLSGSTNIKYLKDHGVTIWDEWADEDGEVGPLYGTNWRAWSRQAWPDQLADAINGIRRLKDDPTAPCGRRLIVTAWNPEDIPDLRLPPCHILYQFNVVAGRLSCLVSMRSADIFLGVPYNVASYALLTHLVAQLSDLIPCELIFSFGDLHLYTNHIEQAEEQLTREPRPLPRLVLDPVVKAIDDFRRQSASVEGYNPHGRLIGEVAV
jgi:thymidylate synthase